MVMAKPNKPAISGMDDNLPATDLVGEHRVPDETKRRGFTLISRRIKISKSGSAGWSTEEREPDNDGDAIECEPSARSAPPRRAATMWKNSTQWLKIANNEFSTPTRLLFASIVGFIMAILLILWGAEGGYPYVIFAGLIIFLLVECMWGIAVAAMLWKISARIIKYYRSHRDASGTTNGSKHR